MVLSDNAGGKQVSHHRSDCSWTHTCEIVAWNRRHLVCCLRFVGLVDWHSLLQKFCKNTAACEIRTAIHFQQSSSSFGERDTVALTEIWLRTFWSFSLQPLTTYTAPLEIYNSPDLACFPPDFRIFWHLKSFLGGQNLNNDDDLKEHAATWLAMSCEQVLHNLMPKYNRCQQIGGSYV